MEVKKTGRGIGCGLKSQGVLVVVFQGFLSCPGLPGFARFCFKLNLIQGPSKKAILGLLFFSVGYLGSPSPSLCFFESCLIGILEFDIQIFVHNRDSWI